MSANGDPVALVVSRLPSARPAGKNQWQAMCPGHKDNKASLCIGRGDDGRALVYCQAGCSVNEVLAAMRLTPSDLFVPSATPRNPKAGRKIVKVYDYRNADGDLRYQKVRLEPKAFSQRRGDGNGGWVWGLTAGEYVCGKSGRDWYKANDSTPPAAERGNFPEEPQLLYRLPELLQADPAEWVFEAEGEKDVDNIVALGLTATCNSGGAGKWKHLSDDSALHGRRVCIIPDNDDPGRRHAQDVAARLHGKAKEIRVLTLTGMVDDRPVKDASDYLTAGGPADSISDVRGHLLALADAASIWTPETTLVSAGDVGGDAVGDLGGDVDGGVVGPGPVGLPYRPFPVETLPEPAASFVAAASAAIGCDPSFVALPLLSALAAAIGNTRLIQLKTSWREPSIIWSGTVGESGTHKSPGLAAPMTALERRQQEALRDFQRAQDQHAKDLLHHKDALSAWKKGELAEPPVEPKPPVCRRYFVADITIEALAVRLAENPRGLLVKRDELSGWLNSFGQYKAKKGGGGDSAGWLEMFQGKSLTVDRKNADCPLLYVPRAAVSICGGIQPGTLARALGQEHLEDGLAARLLLAMPPDRPRRWSDNEIDPGIEAALADLFNKLWCIPQYVDAITNAPLPKALPLTPEARQVFVGFVNAHGEEMARLHGPIRAAYSKLEGYAARLALVFHCIREVEADSTLESPGAVDAASVAAGVHLVQWFAHEAQRVYGMLAETEGEADQRQIVEVIRCHGGAMTERELRQATRQYRHDAEGAEAALQSLVTDGLGTWENVGPGPAGGRPTRRFRLKSGGGVYETPEIQRQVEVSVP